jgi:SAM-dependent methyltransferase
VFSALSKGLRAFAEKDGRGYPDWAMRYVPVVRRIKPQLPDRARVLEVGANENGYARFAKTPVVAIDIAFDHLQAARASQSVAPVVADVGHLPFRDDAFDGYVCMDTFEHFKETERERAIAEMSRILTKAGCAAVGFPEGDGAEKAEARIRAAHHAYTGRTFRWLEEHCDVGLPDAAALIRFTEGLLTTSHRVTLSKNANLAIWAWMWRVLICGWPGRGNALFQALLRLSTPLLCRMHFGQCYRAIIWVEPRHE